MLFRIQSAGLHSCCRRVVRKQQGHLLFEGNRIVPWGIHVTETVGRKRQGQLLFEGNRIVPWGIPTFQRNGMLVSSFGQTVEATATQSELKFLTRGLKLISKDILTLITPPSHDEEDNIHDCCWLLGSTVLPTMMGFMETILLAPQQSQLDKSWLEFQLSYRPPALKLLS